MKNRTEKINAVMKYLKGENSIRASPLFIALTELSPGKYIDQVSGNTLTNDELKNHPYKNLKVYFGINIDLV